MLWGTCHNTTANNARRRNMTHRQSFDTTGGGRTPPRIATLNSSISVALRTACIFGLTALAGPAAADSTIELAVRKPDGSPTANAAVKITSAEHLLFHDQ